MFSISKANSAWRPTLAWILVFYITLTIGNIIVMAWIRPESPGINILLQLLFTLLAAALGKSVVRQTGKNKIVDANENIRIAEITDDEP